ncbi:TetR/AcrR family transcriptional regulator [Paenibacillus lautus]|uniref:TetR family transcriptional regulator n=1 Tax=Paenibacillus lautus TaxID=1401 RepID=A0A385TL44_PAELA|nr:TetR family transcriptional regulator C-terminal domain-containing protein [Paenibacillus lautus]AYB44373.1 TetR family transcriptional regulator [Paenibacillus lautus]MBY0161983.1 TetR family transcriptional regulator C-terminal domain-containing protein [Cytobacillus firmus]
MPKVVDHEQKRKLIAESAWNIIKEKGIEHASIRAVAAAAGLSPGALRHYFSTQDELLLFIVDYYLTRGVARAEERLEISPIPMKAAREILLLLLPLDTEKRTATGVWWVFAIRSLTSLALQAKKDELTDGLHYLTKAVLEILAEAKLLPSSVDIQLETLRLAAIVEGLTILALLRPELYTPETVEQIVSRHLQELCSQAMDE